ncbi:MAG: endonuclease/exonuclease/phosphatase family protein [Clostridiaceae bacterium]
MKKVLKIVLGIVLFLCILVGVFFLVLTVFDYSPKDIVSLEVDNKVSINMEPKKTFTITTYNIGYCGLDDEQDFFLDGGTGSRSSSEEKTNENLEAVVDFIKNQDSDFVFIQEVDRNSTRTFHVDECEYIKSNLIDYSATFASNYKVLWNPVPVTKPIGYIDSGLLTLSKYSISDTNRIQYPGEEKWPRKIVVLDRCFIETRINLDNGKDLVLLNSHMSAYDKGGLIRKQQIEFLKGYIEDEYEKGNYVVVGGDWNHQLPGTDATNFETTEEWPEWLQEIPESFKPEEFKWAVDKETPSNRSVDMLYKPGENFLCVIDGFLVSPNVDIQDVKGFDFQFKNSDHNPVTVELTLK